MSGIQLAADSYKSVLYLTAGGESWLAPYQDLPIPWPQEAKKKESILMGQESAFQV